MNFDRSESKTQDSSPATLSEFSLANQDASVSIETSEIGVCYKLEFQGTQKHHTKPWVF